MEPPHNHPPTKELVATCDRCRLMGNVFFDDAAATTRQLQGVAPGSEVGVRLLHGRYVVLEVCAGHCVVGSTTNAKYKYRVLPEELEG